MKRLIIILFFLPLFTFGQRVLSGEQLRMRPITTPTDSVPGLLFYNSADSSYYYFDGVQWRGMGNAALGTYSFNVDSIYRNGNKFAYWGDGIMRYDSAIRIIVEAVAPNSKVLSIDNLTTGVAIDVGNHLGADNALVIHDYAENSTGLTIDNTGIGSGSIIALRNARNDTLGTPGQTGAKKFITASNKDTVSGTYTDVFVIDKYGKLGIGNTSSTNMIMSMRNWFQMKYFIYAYDSAKSVGAYLDSSRMWKASRYWADVADGTKPFTTTSQTLNTNFNADLLDGYHANELMSGNNEPSIGNPYYTFDSDVITVANDPSIEFGTGNYSIALTIRTTMATSAGIIATGAWVNAKQGYLIRLASGVPKLQMSDGTTVFWASSNTTKINDGAWHVIIWSIDRTGNAVLYIDGVQDYSADISAYSANSVTNYTDLTICSYNSAAFLTGDISDVLIYSKALTSSEAITISSNVHNVQLADTAYLELMLTNSKSWKTWYDLTDNVNNGTISGATLILPEKHLYVDGTATLTGLEELTAIGSAGAGDPVYWGDDSVLYYYAPPRPILSALGLKNTNTAAANGALLRSALASGKYANYIVDTLYQIDSATLTGTFYFLNYGQFDVSDSLIIRGEIKAGMHQIFSLTSAGKINADRANYESYPEWFGAVGLGDQADSTTNRKAFQAVVDVFPKSIKVKGNKYIIDSTITLPADVNMEFTGFVKDMVSANNNHFGVLEMVTANNYPYFYGTKGGFYVKNFSAYVNYSATTPHTNYVILMEFDENTTNPIYHRLPSRFDGLYINTGLPATISDGPGKRYNGIKLTVRPYSETSYSSADYFSYFNNVSITGADTAIYLSGDTQDLGHVNSEFFTNVSLDKCINGVVIDEMSRGNMFANVNFQIDYRTPVQTWQTNAKQIIIKSFGNTFANTHFDDIQTGMDSAIVFEQVAAGVGGQVYVKNNRILTTNNMRDYTTYINVDADKLWNNLVGFEAQWQQTTYNSLPTIVPYDRQNGDSYAFRIKNESWFDDIMQVTGTSTTLSDGVLQVRHKYNTNIYAIGVLDLFAESLTDKSVGWGGNINMYSKDSGETGDTLIARISWKEDDATTENKGALYFYTRDGTTLQQALKIDNTQKATFQADMQVTGATTMSGAVYKKSNTTTVAASFNFVDYDYYIYCDDGGGSLITGTLPALSGSTNREFVVVNMGTGSITIAVQTGEYLNKTLNGTLTVAPGETAVLHNSGIASIGWGGALRK